MKAILSGRISRDIARGGGAGRGAGFHPVTDIDPIRTATAVRFGASHYSVCRMGHGIFVYNGMP
jgi:hypothetical protein